jgi:hypothetical protein
MVITAVRRVVYNLLSAGEEVDGRPHDRGDKRLEKGNRSYLDFDNLVAHDDKVTGVCHASSEPSCWQLDQESWRLFRP